MQKTPIIIGVFISVFFSKNLTAAEPLEFLKDAKAHEVIQNEKASYTLNGKPLNFDPCHSSVNFKVPSSNTKLPFFLSMSQVDFKIIGELLMYFMKMVLPCLAMMHLSLMEFQKI